ncbi:hypothetical protein GCM10020000_00770 [Streptomyces olivoverticillatus]
MEVSTRGWPEGAYLIRLTSDAGDQRYVPLTVRSARTAGKLVLVNAVGTWQAYNTWGGHSLYYGPGGKDDYASRSLAVSCDRPYDRDGAPLFTTYEQPAVALAEKLGLPLAYVTSMDLDREPELLRGAHGVVSLGHDEYWTPAMRSRVTAARDAGTNVAFLGGRTPASGGSGWSKGSAGTGAWWSATRPTGSRTRCPAGTTHRSRRTGVSRRTRARRTR